MDRVENNLKLLLTSIQINEIVETIANNISNDFKKQEIVLIGVLNGSFIFLADLIRKIKCNCVVDFIGISSYNDTATSGKIILTKDINIDLHNKNVIIVEDVVDTGNTITFLKKYFTGKGVKSLKICSLVNKIKKHNINVDYWGIELYDFIVGYGFDYKYYYRNLPNIYCIKEKE